MESFFFFLFNKKFDFKFCPGEKREEGRRVSHRIFPWQIGDSPRASYRAHWHSVPAAERSVGQALGLRSVLERPELSVELGRRELSAPAVSRPLPPDPGRGRAPRSRRGLLRGPERGPGGRPRPGT